MPFASSTPLFSSHCEVSPPSSAVLKLLELLEISDINTYQHSLNVAAHVYNFASFLDLNKDEINDAYYGALLHDVGKLRFLNIINKPEALTKEEKSELNKHPLVSYLLLSTCNCSDTVRFCGLFHHYNDVKKFGYPSFSNELVSEIEEVAAKLDLPLPNIDRSEFTHITTKQWQIINVVTLFDSLDTITDTSRPYRDAILLSEVVDDFISNEKYNWNTLFEHSMQITFQKYVSMLQEPLM